MRLFGSVVLIIHFSRDLVTRIEYIHVWINPWTLEISRYCRSIGYSNNRIINFIHRSFLRNEQFFPTVGFSDTKATTRWQLKYFANRESHESFSIYTNIDECSSISFYDVITVPYICDYQSVIHQVWCPIKWGTILQEEFQSRFERDNYPFGQRHSRNFTRKHHRPNDRKEKRRGSSYFQPVALSIPSTFKPEN